MAGQEKVLVESHGVFELVNASELLSFDPNGGFDAAQHETNTVVQDSIIGLVHRKSIDLKLEVEGEEIKEAKTGTFSPPN